MISLDRAACRDIDPTVLDPPADDEDAVRAAKELCSGCEVRLECLAIAFNAPSLPGVWGGLTAAERARFHHPSRSPATRRR